MEYRVQLDVFNGPLDLLLYLIKRDELDITDIPISRILDSYMQYLNQLRELRSQHGIDINVAGDFLVMAATLMEIKSAMLLPRPPQQEQPDPTSASAELSDPRYELVKQLLEYKRVRESATRLEQLQEQHAARYPRYPAPLHPDNIDEMPPLDLEEVQVWDLLAAFSRLMSEVGVRSAVHEVLYDDTPIALHATDIEDRLQRDGRISLRALLIGRRSKSEMIGVFLAVLELVKQRRVLAEQTEGSNDIEIVTASAEHRAGAPETQLHIAPESRESAAPADTPAEPPTPGEQE